jgi:hypothetical protein
MTLISGHLIPLHGFFIVFRNSRANFVYQAKIILSVGISLIGGEPEPLHCFFIISRNTMAIGVDHAIEVSLPTEVPEIRNGMLDGIASFARSL